MKKRAAIAQHIITGLGDTPTIQPETVFRDAQQIIVPPKRGRAEARTAWEQFFIKTGYNRGHQNWHRSNYCRKLPGGDTETITLRLPQPDSMTYIADRSVIKSMY